MQPSSDSDLQALHAAAEALARDPGDLDALYRVASAMEARSRKAEAAEAYAALSALAREEGQVALGLAAAKTVEALGDAARGGTLVSALGKAYAAGTTRVDEALRPHPPAPPARGKGSDTSPPKGKGAGREADVVARAVAAVAKSSALALDQARKGGKLPAVPLVHALSPGAFEQFAGAMAPSARRAGEVVIDVGEEATSLFLVARGLLAVTRDEHALGHLRPGAFFGEIALLGGTRRTARVACVEDAWLLEVPLVALEAAASAAPELAETLATHARTRLLANMMRTSEIFRRLAPEEREVLIGRFEPEVHEPDVVIHRQGEAGQRLHVIVSGGVDVRQDGQVLAHLSPGEVFGEMSLLGRKPATADVVAQVLTVTLSLDKRSFDHVAMRHPELLAEVYKLIVEREARANAGTIEVDEDDAIVV